MSNYLVSINDLPPDGKTFQLTDQDIWLDPIKEFKMDCKIEEPLQATIFVMPADEGCLVRGSLKGKVVVPCNRCAEDARVTLDSNFDEYEEVPKEGNSRSSEGERRIVFERNSPMLNLAEVAWEQFMLAMPVMPVCQEGCKGLCPQCGTNLNLGSCDCVKPAGDPRLEALRNVKIS